MLSNNKIVIKKASEHNLKNISLAIPKHRFIVITGVSGSGKSSLAFDTIFKEGQRRYISSLSAYARQFLNQMERPQVDFIEGLSPTICIDQKSVGRNPRSTVGTITEIYDFLRLLFSRLGVAYCPKGHGVISSQTPEMIVNHVFNHFEEEEIFLMSPVILDRKGEYRKELESYRLEGFVRVMIDGLLCRLDEEINIKRYEKHRIEIVIDRLKITSEEKERIKEGVKKAIDISGGRISLLRVSSLEKENIKKRVRYSSKDYSLYTATNSCATCGYSIPELEPSLFSFNSLRGACSQCDGMGYKRYFDFDKCIKNESKSIFEGALYILNESGNVLFANKGRKEIINLYKKYKQKIKTPWKELPDFFKERLFKKEKNTKIKDNINFDIFGALEFFYRKYKISFLEKYQKLIECSTCEGKRLNELALHVQFAGKSIHDFVTTQVKDLEIFFNEANFNRYSSQILNPILKEIKDRLFFLMNVGLEYLTIERRANTLSGGEAQRIRLASQVGSGLEGCLYILDEPSIGLHQSDNRKLINTLKKLRDHGNTVIVIEHDEETILSSDYLVDIGPKAGKKGGYVCFNDIPSNFSFKQKETENGRYASKTMEYLFGHSFIKTPVERRKEKQKLFLKKINQFNIKSLDLSFSLENLIVLAGVSGSGKSTLVEVLKESISEFLNKKRISKSYESIEGCENLFRVIEIDQKPIGRTPRSNASTYTKAWDFVRDLYAMLPESKIRGYLKGRFSFNVKGGRCENCGGGGSIEIDMQIFSSAEVICEECNGKRFNSNTLDIHYKGKNIYDILEMTVEEAYDFFKDIPKLNRILKVMNEIGLGYLKLGQSSTTLSGGEAQRIKLASELGKTTYNKTLYLLDEPTTGLHFDDIKRLLKALENLVDRGNTVLIIEHNLDVVKFADYIIEMGPKGGDEGGKIIFSGTPEEIIKTKTPTGIEMNLFMQRQSKREKGYFLKNQNKLFESFSSKKEIITSDNHEASIEIKGLTKNNLKNINLSLPKNQIITITGVSGSGKTSIALDTIFQEGQRKYINSLSTYARRFLDRLERPQVDDIQGISPTIAVDQKAASKNPRSTVATQTEIYDSFRILYANIGILHCSFCRKKLEEKNPTNVFFELIKNKDQMKKSVMVAAPLFIKESSKKYLLENKEKLFVFISILKEKGFLRLLMGKEVMRLDVEEEKIKETLQDCDNIYLVIDRIYLEEKEQSRFIEAFEKAYEIGHGVGLAYFEDNKKVHFSKYPMCFEHDLFYEEKLTPRHFSFNHHLGACQRCEGIGKTLSFQKNLFIINENLPFLNGAIKSEYHTFFASRGKYYYNANFLRKVANENSIDLWETPYKSLLEEEKRMILFGYFEDKFLFLKGKKWPGIASIMENLINSQAGSEKLKNLFSKCVAFNVCPQCLGGRLKNQYLSVLIENINIAKLTSFNLKQAFSFFETLPQKLTSNEAMIAKDLLEETQFRLKQMLYLGIDYLTLNRQISTLSGGEAQRIRLSTQIGNKLNDVIYVLDEPTIGLHESDTEKLFKAILNLKKLGNTVILVEHDENIIKQSDWIVDVGPKAGELGGKIIYNGENQKQKLKETSFFPYLYSDKKNKQYRKSLNPLFNKKRDPYLLLSNVNKNNIKGIDVEIPIGQLVGISGVSGSGKSSLIFDWFFPRVKDWIGKKNVSQKDLSFFLEGKKKSHIPFKFINVVDQLAVSPSIRSTASSYLDIFHTIRKIFANTKSARLKGFLEGAFSFNTPVGRCNLCQGIGSRQVNMHFISDVNVVCEECKGKRYKKEVLSVYYKEKNIFEVLQMTFLEAYNFFDARKSVRDKIKVVLDTGLDYLKLGSGTHILSGGELQRLKLAKELSKKEDLSGNLYILDEPTTGLHFSDVEKLLGVLEKLVARGNTVIVIEHNPHFLLNMDYIIDMGPKAGEKGGKIVASGSVEQLKNKKEGLTYLYL